jgi:UDP-glucose 4-epimerase
MEFGARVTVVDRRGIVPNRTAGATFRHADYADNDVLYQLADDGVNGFVHCAGSSLVGPSIDNPSEYYNNNVAKTIMFLDNLKTWKNVPFVVFSSSAAVYGAPEYATLDEGVPSDPINPYGNTKMMIERILHDYDVAHDIRSFCFRYFNAAGANKNTGPEINDTHLIPRIFEALYRNESFKLFGTDYNTPDGTCVRDYIHIDDLAEAHCIGVRELADGSASKVYNLGTNEGYSNKEILDIFLDVVGPLQIENYPRRIGDPDSLVANTSAIAEDLGWFAQKGLVEIIQDMHEFYMTVKDVRYS